MKVRWSKLLLKTAVWFCAEVMLTFMGLDDLADYGEFVFQDRSGPAFTEASTDFGALV